MARHAAVKELYAKMYPRLAFALLAAGWSAASASISDAEAIRLAKRYAIALGYEKWNLDGFAVTQDCPHVSPARLHVSGGGMHIDLEPDGRLFSFSSSSKDASPDREHFDSSEQVWQLVERLAKEFDAEPNLHREMLERTPERSPLAYGRAYRVRLAQRPFGYPSAGGNRVDAVIRRSDGTILEFTIFRGFEYERPNVRISESEARRIATEGFGGDPGSWRVDLKFWQFNEKLMRLAYILHREQPNGVAMVMIDVASGEVLDFMRQAVKTSPPTSNPSVAVEGWEPNPGPDPPKNFGKPLPTSIYAAVAVFTAVSAVLAYVGIKRWTVR